MTRPEEAFGLTTAIAKSVELRVIDLATLLSDDTYDAELYRLCLVSRADTALNSLLAAARQLRDLAKAIAAEAASNPPRIDGVAEAVVPLRSRVGEGAKEPDSQGSE